MIVRRFATSVCFLLLFAGGRGLFSGEGDKQAVGQAALGLLEAGFRDQAVSIADLEETYAAARRMIGRDHPYVEYAFALVLSRNFAPEEAAPHLRSAADAEEPVVFAAREDLIRTRIEAGDQLAAIEMLVELAEAVRRVPAQSPAAADAHRCAACIGRMLAYLEGPCGVPAVAARAASAHLPIRALLGGDYLPDLQAGRSDVIDMQRALAAQLGSAAHKVQSAKAGNQQQAQDKQQELNQQQQALARTTEQLNATFQQQLRDIDARLSLLDKHFTSSLETEQRLLAAQAVLQVEIARLKQQLNGMSGTRNVVPASLSLQQMALRDQALADAEGRQSLYANEYTQLLRSRSQLIQAAQILFSQRQEITSQFRSAATGVNQQLEFVNRWKSRLELAAKQESQATVGKTPAVTLLRRRMSDLATYDHPSYEDQRHRLQQLLEQEIPQAAR